MPRAFYHAQPAVGDQAFYNFGVRKRCGGVVFTPYKQRGAGNIAYNIPQIGVYERYHCFAQNLGSGVIIGGAVVPPRLVKQIFGMPFKSRQC